MGSTTTQAPGRLAFPAMITGSACLAFGPWLVRLADVGPLASAFWRQALAVPFLLALAFVVRAPGGKPAGFAGTTLGIVGLTALAGFAFAADLSVWHLGIMRTTLANSTLLANAATSSVCMALTWSGVRPATCTDVNTAACAVLKATT